MAEQRMAVVVDGTVWSVTAWDPEAAPEWRPARGAAVPCGPEVEAGDAYADGAFVRPPVPEPTPEETLARIKAYLADHPDVAAAIQP